MNLVNFAYLALFAPDAPIGCAPQTGLVSAPPYHLHAPGRHCHRAQDP